MIKKKTSTEVIENETEEIVRMSGWSAASTRRDILIGIRRPASKTTKNKYQDFTMTIDGSSNFDSGIDQIKILDDNSGEVLWSGTLNDVKKTVNLKLLRATKLKIIVSNSRTKKGGPGAYVAKIKIKENTTK